MPLVLHTKPSGDQRETSTDLVIQPKGQDLAISPEVQREQITLNLTLEQHALLIFLVENSIAQENPDSTTLPLLTDILAQLNSTGPIVEIFCKLHSSLQLVIKNYSKKVPLNLTPVQKAVLTEQVKAQWRSSLSNPDIEERQGVILQGIYGQLETIDPILGYNGLILRSARRATLQTRQEGLEIGETVGISDSPDEKTYELISVNGEIATIGYDTPERVRKTIRAKYLFHLKYLRD